MTLYLDSSALVKLVAPEAESPALQAFLERGPEWVSSTLAFVELARASRIRGGSSPRRAELILGRARLLPINDDIVRSAANLEPPRLRSLDAIHLATALVLEPELTAVVTYDTRMQEAAAALGMPVAAPA